MGKRLGSKTAEKADLNWPKGRSMPHNIRLSNETGSFQSTCCSDTAWASGDWWSNALCIIFLFLLLLHLLNCPYHNSGVLPCFCSSSFFSFSSWGSRRNKRAAHGCSVSMNSQPHVLPISKKHYAKILQEKHVLRAGKSFTVKQYNWKSQSARITEYNSFFGTDRQTLTSKAYRAENIYSFKLL